MSWKGQVALEGTLYFLFTTRRFSTGAPYTLAGTPVLSCYEENNATQITSGVSVSADYDSVTGLNQATVVATAANGYESGKRYDVVITTGTVDSVSVVGEVVGSFMVGPALADVVAISGDSTAADNLETACDNYSATRGLAGTALPAAAANAAGGLPISTAGGLDMDSIKSDTTAILEDTGTTIPGLFPTYPTNFSSLSIDGSGKVTLVADQSGVTVGTVNALGAQAKADVNAEVVDTLNVDTYTEPGQEAPGVNVSLVKKIGYLYKAWRNRSTQTAALYTLYADDASTADQKATFSDDDTTADRGEMATGA